MLSSILSWLAGPIYLLKLYCESNLLPPSAYNYRLFVDPMDFKLNCLGLFHRLWFKSWSTITPPSLYIYSEHV